LLSTAPHPLSSSLPPFLPSPMPSFSQWCKSHLILSPWLPSNRGPTDSQQYAAWNRTRRLRASPYLARTDTNTSRRATALATATTNAPSATNDIEANLSEPPKERKQETLFGPNIGIVGDGPAWAQSHDAKKSTTSSDFLTPEIVRRWVEMSKEVLFPFCVTVVICTHLRPDHPTYHHSAGSSQFETPYSKALSARSTNV
jgi:hypothetical protein